MVLGVAYQQALSGDMTTARMILERIVPAFRADQRLELVAIAGNALTEPGRSVLDCLASADLAPSVAA